MYVTDVRGTLSFAPYYVTAGVHSRGRSLNRHACTRESCTRTRKEPRKSWATKYKERVARRHICCSAHGPRVSRDLAPRVQTLSLNPVASRFLGPVSQHGFVYADQSKGNTRPATLAREKNGALPATRIVQTSLYGGRGTTVPTYASCRVHRRSALLG